MSDKKLWYLHELSDYKVDSDYPDVRGWDVTDNNNRTIGKVDNLLVNKDAKRVVYLDVEVDKTIIDDGHEEFQRSASEGVHGFVNREGETHLIIPIGMVDIQENDKRVHTDQIDYDTFKGTKRFSKGSDIDQEYERTVYQTYRPNEELDRSSFDDEFYQRKEFRSR